MVFLTKYFSIKNGIRLGSPISALLYVLAAEPLQCIISDNNNISGISIPLSDKVAKMFQLRGPWTPGKYDVVCSAHFKDIGFSVGIIMLDVFQC